MSSPRVFALPHLSEDAVAAFADGVLSASAAGRARRHCAECAECADAVRGQREAAMLLRTAQAPALPSGLLDRLAGLPMSTPLPPPRGGLPTVLGADGTPVFVAHDVHRALTAAEHPDEGLSGPAQHAVEAARPGHRRGTMPMTMLASAAAVVAAGTFGGHVSTLASSDRPVPAGAAQVAGALAGGRSTNGQNGNQNAAVGQNALLRSPGSLIGTGAVLGTGVPVTGPAAPADDQPHRMAHAPLPASVRVAQSGPQAAHAPGGVPSLQPVPAGFRPMPGEPTATP